MKILLLTNEIKFQINDNPQFKIEKVGGIFIMDIIFNKKHE
jgi:hypothetical protein